MSLAIQKYVSLIDGRKEGWLEQLREQLDSGTNHFLVLPNAPNYLEELTRALELGSERTPQPITKHRLFSLGPFIEPHDFDCMLLAQQQGLLIFFIEQLDLPINRPPRVKPFLVYCPMRGIISQHDNQREARASCDDYKEAMAGLRNHALAADVFKWNGAEWINTETC